MSRELFSLFKQDTLLVNQIHEYLLKEGRKHDEEKKENNDGKYHPSSVCTLCPRKNFLAREFIVERKRNKTSYFALRIGNAIHDVIQGILKEMKVLHSDEMKMEWEDEGVEGSTDGIVVIDGVEYVAEFKTCKAEYFLKYSRFPHRPHVRQIHLYMHMTGIHRGIILYINKNDTALAEHKIEYQPKIVEGLQHIMAEDKKYKALNELPPYYCKDEVVDEWCMVYRKEMGHFCETLTQENYRTEMLKHFKEVK